MTSVPRGVAPASGACGGHSGRWRGLACPWVASRAHGLAGRPDPVRLGRDPAGTLARAGQRLPRAWGMAVSGGGGGTQSETAACSSRTRVVSPLHRR